MSAQADWRRRWVVDLSSCTATHDSGLVVRAAHSPRDDATDFEAENIETWQRTMLASMDFQDVVAYAKQLLHEGVAAYREVQSGRQ